MVKINLLVLIIAFVPSIGHADVKAGEEKAQLCLLCHKPNFSGSAIPLLAGQTREYLYKQIKDFKDKKRAGSFMQMNVANLTDQDMLDIADYFSSRAIIKESFRLDAKRIARGKSKAEILECAACHMADFSGKMEVPSLVAIHPSYIAAQIEAFSAGRRSHPFINGSSGISSSDSEDLVQYFAQLE